MTGPYSIAVNPVLLPQGGPLVREPYVNRRHTDGRPLDAFDRSQLDGRYVFYDLFLRADGSEIIGIGPPLLNLRRPLLPIRAWVDGVLSRTRLETLSFVRRHRLVIRPKGIVLRIPLTGSAKASYVLRLEMGSGLSSRMEIRRDPPLKPYRLTLLTLQKDNRPRWIRDWARYYTLAHGVDRVLLYDNASRDVSPVREALPPSGWLIQWDAPFGATFCFDSRYAKWGALNHARLRFGTSTPILNFDIDELLVINSRSVRDLLSTVPAVHFMQHDVHFSQPPDPDYSYCDFTRRNRRPFRGAWKYGFLPFKTRYNEVHVAQPKRLLPFLRRHYPPSVIAPVEDAYFLHYKGITTDWKRHLNRLVEIGDVKDAVEERAVAAVLNGGMDPLHTHR